MNEKSSKTNKIIISAVVIILVLAIAGGAIFWHNSQSEHAANQQPDTSTEVGTPIDLNSLTEDYVITEAGTYTLHGQTSHSVKVNAPDAEVKLILNDAQIHQTETAAIIGQAAKALTIELAENSESSLSDGGSSEYDACIFSNADLYFTGGGRLTVIGQQDEGEGIATEAKNMTFSGNGTYYITSADDGLNAGGDGGTITINGGNFYIDASGDGIDSNKNAIINGGNIFVMGSDIGGDAGIDTDDGYVINGGSVFAFGSDMIELPGENSTQNTIAFTLDQAIPADTVVTLQKDGTDLFSFRATKSFKTLIISDSELTAGTYTLLQGGEHSGEIIRGIYYNGEYSGGEQISVDGSTDFVVESGINSFGRSGMPGQGPNGGPQGAPNNTPPEPRP